MYRLTSLTFLVLILTACGGGGGSSSSPPPAPTSSAVNDTLNINEDTSAEANVTANDINVSPASTAITTEPADGTATISNGTISYSPNANFNGTDSIGYSVDSNNNSGSNMATLNITVNSVNDAPVANDDSALTNINTSLEIALTHNDSDIDGDALTVQIVDGAMNGSTTTLPDGIVSYAPALDFIGQDTFTYRSVDPSGAESNTATVIITVVDLTQTTLLIKEISIPITGYANVPIGTENEFILASPLINFEISANAVSFGVNLIGSSVLRIESLFILGVRNPQGILMDLRDSVFCDLGLCTIQVPKRPGIIVENGSWALRVATLASSIELVDIGDYQLQLVSRIGPEPGIDSRTTLAVKPFVTGRVAVDDIEEILTRFIDMTSANDIDVVIEPLTVIEDERFAEVDVDFRDEDTTALVLMGDPAKMNLFFLEGFSSAGGGGLLGIAGGIPGALGLESEYNGVLLNGLATQGANKDFYHRTTAEFAFHEMNHLLGLLHTTEADFSEHDILIDTPECLEGSDSNSNGRADSDECVDGLNLMFWQNDLLEEKMGLTADQKQVIRSSVISLDGD